MSLGYDFMQDYTLSPVRRPGLASAPARIVAALLRGIVAPTGFDAAGLRKAHAQIVAARSGWWRRFLATHPAPLC
jgi:hypothetical protein